MTDQPAPSAFRFDWTIPVWQIIPAALALIALIVYVNTIRNNVDVLIEDVASIKRQNLEYDALRADVRVINNQVSRLERMLERLLERRALNGELNMIQPGAGGSEPPSGIGP